MSRPTVSADGSVVTRAARYQARVCETRGRCARVGAVFVLWTEARTPKGVVVACLWRTASSAVRPLGKANGILETLWCRDLVRVIDGRCRQPCSRSAKGGDTVVAVRKNRRRSEKRCEVHISIRRPRKDQGDRISVIVARDWMSECV